MVKVREKDLGLEEYVEKYAMAKGAYTKVGLPEEATPATGDVTDMNEMIVVGAVHEFGAPKVNVPERSWLRSTVDENKDAITKQLIKEAIHAVNGRAELHMALSRVGEWFKGKVQRKITTLKIPPNAPSTIAKKGSSNPLIDTGQFRASVTHVEFIP